MRKRLGWKLILTILAVLLAIYLAFPLKDKIKLGLDLKGGIHLVLQVKTDDTINIEADEEIARLEELLRKNDIEYKDVNKGQPGQFAIHIADLDQKEKIKDLLDEHFKGWNATLVGNTVSLSMKEDVKTYTRDLSVNQAVETIRNRVDEFGVAEPIIQRQGIGGDQIIVELPGVDNPDRVKSIIKTMRKRTLEEVLNASINQTLSRSIITSGTVFLTVISLYFFGGEVINDFAFAMLVGVISGSYSTIYQSCPIVSFWQKIFRMKKGF